MENIQMETCVILVKDPEHQSGELGRIALWEELLVDADESLPERERGNKSFNRRLVNRATIVYTVTM